MNDINFYNEVNLLEYCKIIWKNKKSFINNIVIIGIVSTFIISIFPKTYMASSVLMPPESNSSMQMFSSISEFPLNNIFSGTSDQTMNLIAILKSRTMMESVVDKFNLIEFYNVDNIEEAFKELENNVRFNVEEEGTIRIIVKVKTAFFHLTKQEELAKKLSAEMANYFVKQLDSLNKGLNIEQASFQRIFIEERYRENLKDLKDAENALKQFQENNKMIALEEQTIAAINTAASIKAKILANEVQLGVFTNILNLDHPDVIKIKKETEELNLQLNNMNNGLNKNDVSRKNDNSLFPSFSKIPQLGVQLARLKREVEIQNTLFIFLTKQYEEAKINEARNIPTVQVLDFAKKPIKHYSPKFFLLIVLILSIYSMIFIFVIIIKENTNKQNIIHNAS